MELGRLSKCAWKLPLFSIAAVFLGCSDSPTSSAPASIDRLEMFVRDTREFPGEEVEFILTRSDSGVTLTVFRPGREWRERLVLDSVGPGAEEPEEIRDLLAAYDVWALAERDAPGAACRTEYGEWVCYPASNDYTLVMGIRRGDVYRAQRYTHLELSPSSRPVRALADYVLAWGRRLESGG
jgi:hypothetical protein